MKKKTIFIVIGVILGLALIIFLLTKIPKREFDTFEFPNTMIVENNTNNRMADTITMVLLNKILEYDTMEIQIYPMPAIFETVEDMEYKAYLEPVPFNEHRYTIFLQEDINIGQLKELLSHEIVHLMQYESGRLQVLPDKSGYVWMGDTIMGVDDDYERRPHEVEARGSGFILQKKLNNILYKEN